MRVRIVASAAAACLLTAGASAITPVTTGTRLAQIQLTGPIGQSFTADDSRLDSFGFQFAVANSAATAGPVTFQLLAGAGLSGASLFTTSTGSSFTVPTGRAFTWYDFAVTGVTLTVGQVYTAVVSSPGSSRLGIAFGPTLNTSTGQPTTSPADAYAGGMLYSTGYVDTSAGAAGYCATTTNCDANFRVNALAAVPEPAMWASMTLGFALTGLALRGGLRRRVRFA